MSTAVDAHVSGSFSPGELEPQLAIGGQPGGTVVCAGDSMTPTVSFGARVRVCGVPFCIRRGDVVVLRTNRPGQHVMHRVVWVVPALQWVVHIGDSPDVAAVGVAHRAQIVGKADVPRRNPPLRADLLAVRRLWEGIARRGWRAVTQLAR